MLAMLFSRANVRLPFLALSEGWKIEGEMLQFFKVDCL